MLSEGHVLNHYLVLCDFLLSEEVERFKLFCQVRGGELDLIQLRFSSWAIREGLIDVFSDGAVIELELSGEDVEMFSAEVI